MSNVTNIQGAVMTAIIPERLAQLDTIRLDEGSHGDFTKGHCAMEVVSWLAGLGFTDAPECASRVLRSYTISLNDTWGDADRQRLVPFLPRMVGTAGDGQDEARSFLALDWLIRTYTPAFLDLANLSVEAQALRDLRRIVDMATAEAAGPVVRAGRDKAREAGAAAVDAAGDAARAAASAAWDAAVDAARAAASAAWDAASAARAAAWDAARAAAVDAARAAAVDAARAAAWDAARAAAVDAAGAAARAAAVDAAWDAARAAASAAVDAAWAAARAAAGDALTPTVETLKTSALELLDRMIDPAASSEP